MPKEQISPAVPLTLRRCLLLYACLTGICLVLHNRMVESAAADARKIVHRQVMSNTAPAPLQYRVMTFYAAEGIQRVGRSFGLSETFTASYLIVRGIFTFLAMVLLHRFLQVYVPAPYAVLGVILAFAWMPFTYINYYMQESDPANMVFYLLGYDLIRRRRDGALAALLAPLPVGRGSSRARPGAIRRVVRRGLRDLFRTAFCPRQQAGLRRVQRPRPQLAEF
jgi:uncharacterized membrane protein